MSWDFNDTNPEETLWKVSQLAFYVLIVYYIFYYGMWAEEKNR